MKARSLSERSGRSVVVVSGVFGNAGTRFNEREEADGSRVPLRSCQKTPRYIYLPSSQPTAAAAFLK